MVYPPITDNSNSRAKCHYQSPGGIWDLQQKDNHSLPMIEPRLRGLVLDVGQRNLLNQPKELGPDDDRASLMESGLSFTGHCPRCDHLMREEITFGVMVDFEAAREVVTGLREGVPTTHPTLLT